MRRSFKYRLWTNRNQERELETMLETHRHIYNDALGQRRQAWKDNKASISYYDQTRWHTLQRKVNPFYARVNFTSVLGTLRRVDLAFKAFFRRMKKGENPGYPRFKSKGRFGSVTFNGFQDGVRLIGTNLRLHNVGTIRVKLHRPIEGKVKTVTIKREAEKWYVIFSCDLGPVVVPPSLNPPVGVDVGLESFLVTSEGESEPNPRYFRSALPKLRRRGRAVARKKKGGKNRRKAVRRLARVHARVKNLRREHHHKTALNLVRRYGLIAVESLNIHGMVRSLRLGKSVSDAGWYGFRQILHCKAESAGVRIVEVDPRGTSQACSNCGTVVPKDLGCRCHWCMCGCLLHRDVNAALNILHRGLAQIAPTGRNVAGCGVRVPRSRRRKTLA